MNIKTKIKEEIQQAIYEYDWSRKIEQALDEYDFSNIIHRKIDEYINNNIDLDELIDYALENSIDSIIEEQGLEIKQAIQESIEESIS